MLDCGCHNHLNNRPPVSRIPVANRVLEYDPTHTLTLRRQFTREMNKRFRALKGAIRKSLVENDALGLKRNPNHIVITQAVTPIPPKAFEFKTDAGKVDGFMKWLREAQDQSILEISYMDQVGSGVRQPWTNMYIQSAYQKGIERGRTELYKAGYDVQKIGDVPGGVFALFNRPFHADRVGLLYTRTFGELKSVSSRIEGRVSRILAQGVAEGRNPLDIARQLNRQVDMELNAARTLARTEVIRTHHAATIREYKNAGVLGIKIKAEWSTAGDNRVCPTCMALEGRVYTLDQVAGMIPAHPNCRCVALPVDVTDKGRRR